MIIQKNKKLLLIVNTKEKYEQLRLAHFSQRSPADFSQGLYVTRQLEPQHRPTYLNHCSYEMQEC